MAKGSADPSTASVGSAGPDVITPPGPGTGWPRAPQFMTPWPGGCMTQIMTQILCKSHYGLARQCYDRFYDTIGVCETHDIMPRLFYDTLYDTMVRTEIPLHTLPIILGWSMILLVCS